MTRLSAPLVCAYLDTLLETRTNGFGKQIYVAGQPVHPDDLRRIRQWKVEEYDPTLWRLDTLLTRYGIHVNDFLAWCPEDPWVDGEPWFEKVAA